MYGLERLTAAGAVSSVAGKVTTWASSVKEALGVTRTRDKASINASNERRVSFATVLAANMLVVDIDTSCVRDSTNTLDHTSNDVVGIVVLLLVRETLPVQADVDARRLWSTVLVAGDIQVALNHHGSQLASFVGDAASHERNGVLG